MCFLDGSMIMSGCCSRGGKDVVVSLDYLIISVTIARIGP
jgi:hypothetical protein